MLAEVPVSAQLRAELGPVVPDSNNDRDLRILAALNANAVNLLVSDDDGLRRRARRIGIGDQVLTLDDAAAMLEDLEPSVASPPPMVDHVQSYAVDFDQGIFGTTRDDYSDFDQWKAKVQGDSTNRDCFVIKESGNAYAAIAILKINEAGDRCANEPAAIPRCRYGPHVPAAHNGACRERVVCPVGRECRSLLILAWSHETCGPTLKDMPSDGCVGRHVPGIAEPSGCPGAVRHVRISAKGRVGIRPTDALGLRVNGDGPTRRQGHGALTVWAGRCGGR
jgi:hypothetical protein